MNAAEPRHLLGGNAALEEGFGGHAGHSAGSAVVILVMSQGPLGIAVLDIIPGVVFRGSHRMRGRISFGENKAREQLKAGSGGRMQLVSGPWTFFLSSPPSRYVQHDERRDRCRVHIRRIQVRACVLFPVPSANPHSHPLIEHVYRSRPPSADAILPLFLAHPAPRPPLLYFPDLSPPVTAFSIVQSNLLFLALSEVDTEPLLVLEFLHRVVDALENFVGAPLLSSKIQANYDVVAQLLHEMCDGGIVCNTESNALQEAVEMPGWMGRLLGGVGLTGWVLYRSGLFPCWIADVAVSKPFRPFFGSAKAIEAVDILSCEPGPCHSLEESRRSAYFERTVR